VAVVNVVLALLVLSLAWWFVSSVVRRYRRGIVAERGMSVGADLGSLADKPRVRVRAVSRVGPDRVRLILSPETGPDDGRSTSPDLDLMVFLSEEEFGFEQLREWKRSDSPLAIVLPPDSRIVRLRSIDDLQPLTLRRVDGG
jgi:hypothetical protein